MTAGPAPHRRTAETGLTLIEVLVVLAIIAIVTGAVMLRLGIGRAGDDLAAEATALALAITAASDAALASGQDRGFEIGPEGYRLAPAADLATTAWYSLDPVSFADPSSARFVLKADGASAPFRLLLRAGQTSAPVLFDGVQARVEVGP